MKNYGYLFLIVILFVNCCTAENEVDDYVEEELIAPGTTEIKLAIDLTEKENLVLSDNNGLKSAAISFISSVNSGDTVKWYVDEESNINTIEEIIIVDKECDELFENGVVFNPDKTECFAVLAQEANGEVKYDIRYVCADGTEVIVDPYLKVKKVTPPPRE
ncbi:MULTISPECIES: hypothetical protein [unclassified Saccharicrinis]|uniref:hypothetical protein n=1 Tax=unclassified Saccharicrinis TaxID=2646859 RepID=UPI003D34D4A8